MSLYMYQAAYTPESWAAQLKNPQNRAETVGRALCEAAENLSTELGFVDPERSRP